MIEIKSKKTYTETNPALTQERNQVMHHHRNPIHCILPPHLLKEIAANGSETQKQMAVDTINSTTQLRADRLKMTEYRAAFAAQMIQSVTGGKERIVYDAQNGS